MHGREYYLGLRARYEPDDVRMIIVAESPPVSGKYFYDPTGRPMEPLFRALIQSTLGITPIGKSEGLEAFAKAGFVLVDATYQPVNALSGRQRDRIILDDYPILKQDLLALSGSQNSRILLIKVNVCRLLEEKLLADGFNVVNHGTAIPFPGSGHYTEFLEKISPLVLK
jgi:hypothetical protein